MSLISSVKVEEEEDSEVLSSLLLRVEVLQSNLGGDDVVVRL